MFEKCPQWNEKITTLECGVHLLEMIEICVNMKQIVLDDLLAELIVSAHVK